MRDTLAELIERNEQVFLLSGDLGFGVFDKLRNKSPKRFINCGIAEQSMIGIAAGMALNGLKVVIYSIGNFPTLRCIEQIRNDLAYHNLSALIVCVGAGFSYGSLGPSHYATEDISCMRSIPGVKVFSPAVKDEIPIIFDYFLSTNDTVYLRLDKSSINIENNISTFEINEPRIMYKGENKIAIFATSASVQESINAAQKSKILPTVYSIVNISDTNPSSIDLIDKKFENIVCVEEHSTRGGLLSFLLEQKLKVNSKIHSNWHHMGVVNVFEYGVGSADYLRGKAGVSSKDILNKLKEF
jgi:transketolase